MKTLLILFGFFCITLFPMHVKAESFSWSTSGYIGWLYAQPTQTEGTHTGIDIWSNHDGTWNNNNQIGNGNPVYPAYAGTIVFKGDDPDHGDGYIIYHRAGLYTAYWHVTNKQKSMNNYVNITDYLGNQSAYYPNSPGSANANAVHLHFAVLSSGSDTYGNSLDPTNYLGKQLRFQQPAAPGWLDTYVSNSNNCGGTNVIIQNRIITGNFDCGATNNIDILPNTNINNAGNIRFHIN